MRFFLSILLVWAVSAVDAFAQGLKAESANFTLIADRSVDAETILSDLETFRLAVLDDLDLSAASQEHRLTINIVDDQRVFNAISPGGISVAVYRTSAISDDIVMGYSDAEGHLLSDALDPKWLRLVLRHETVHHILERYYPRKLPIWLEEGLAEYYSTYRANEDGHASFGRPFPEQETLHELGGWLPTRVVIENLSHYPDFNTFDVSAYRAQQIYYSQARALAHIIMDQPEGLAKIHRFIEGWSPDVVDNDETGELSFERAFGLRYDLLAEQAQAREAGYISDETFEIDTPLQEQVGKPVTITALTEQDRADNHLRLLMTHGHKSSRVDRLIEQVQFEHGGEQDTASELGIERAFRALRMGNLDHSDDITSDLLDANAEDRLALRIRAQVAYKRLNEFQMHDIMWMEAEEAAIEALAHNPDDAELHLLRAAAIRPQPGGLSASAIRSLDWLEARNIHARLPNTAMMMVPALVYEERFDYADKVLDSAARWAINPADAWVIDDYRATANSMRLRAEAAE